MVSTKNPFLKVTEGFMAKKLGVDNVKDLVSKEILDAMYQEKESYKLKKLMAQKFASFKYCWKLKPK